MSEDFLKNPLSLFDVRGKTAIVTGASGAFGALAAKVLAGAGCNLVLAAGGADALKTVAAECEGLRAKTEAANLRPNSAASCDKIVEAAVKRFGGVDILVLASGINKVSKIVDQPPETFMEVMDVNVTQSWLMARAAGKQMLAQGRGGKVVFMSSARGLLGHPAGYTAYCASKSAVDGITRALGCEWGDAGITVNAIAPTVFRSALTAWMFDDTDRAREVRKGFLTRVPKGRLGEASDLARPLLFLASAASDFYTGKIFNVEIISKDSQSNANRAAEVASELILRDKVDLIVGAATPDTTNPVADQAEVNEVPCITTNCPWQPYFFGRKGDPKTGFTWTYHFFWGLEDVIAAFLSLWEGVPTNKVVGGLFPNDADGNAWGDPQRGLPPALAQAGYRLIDPGRYQLMNNDFTSQISTFKAVNAEIVTGNMIPPDFAT